MTGLAYIKQRFLCIGSMTDTGANDFAIDNNLGSLLDSELSTVDCLTIATAVNSFIANDLLHPKSVNENGFSISWNDEQIKAAQKILLSKYGITLNDETAALLGFSVVADKSDLW